MESHTGFAMRSRESGSYMNRAERLAARMSCAQERAIQADKVVDSIGVNTHFAYTNTNYYQQYSQVIAALKSAGIRHIRDGYHDWPIGNRMYAIHQALAAASIHTNF